MSALSALAGGAALATRYGPTAMKLGAVVGKALARRFFKRKTVKSLGYQRGRARIPKQVELHAFDTTQNNAIKSAAPTFSLLNALVNGSEIYNRVGRKIYQKSLQIRGTIFCNATSPQDWCRIIVFYDSNPNGAAPAIADLLKDSTAAGATTVFSGINLDNRERFKILKDYQVMLPSVTNTGGGAGGVLTNFADFDPIGPNSLNVSWFLPLKGLEAVYNATNGGGIADINTGALYCVTFSGNASSDYFFNFTSRLRFYD